VYQRSRGTPHPLRRPPLGWRRFAPHDPRHFGFHAQVFIGTPEDDLADSFDVMVCSPTWFVDHVERDGAWDTFEAGPPELPDAVLPGAGIWFMRTWDPAQFEAALKAVCASASGGPDWGSVASRVGRLIPWEYDYRHDAHVDSRHGEAFPPR
jgi:hypothetical protein